MKGLPEDLAAALASVPVDEKAQLELAARWPDLTGAAARVCERLQIRVLTWDPLGWLDDRDTDPVVTVEGAGSSYRITLFLGAWELESGLFGTAAELLTGLVDSIVRVGARNEESLIAGNWLSDEEEGLVPSLLNALRPEVPGPGSEVDLVASWRPIDAQTVATVVAGEFGPVALDLTPRALPAASVRSSTCPACAGERFSVPFEIDLARPAMCAPHQKKALQLMLDAVGRAEKANAESWEVFCHAAADLLPSLHVPYPLRHRLVDAGARLTIPSGDDDLLTEQADALLAFTEWVGSPERFEAAMWDMGWRPIDGPAREDRAFEDFALTIAYRLGAARQFTVAAHLADALVALLPHMAANIDGELASQLAEAGRDEEARARLRAALDHPSRDLLTQVYAGEVEEAAGDRDAAENRYRSALTEARRSQDADMEHDILWHLIELLEDDDDRADEVAALRRERDEARARTATDPDEDEVATSPGVPITVGPKVGRNEPCPCGSGRKYKRCHGGDVGGDPSAVVDP